MKKLILIFIILSSCSTPYSKSDAYYETVVEFIDGVIKSIDNRGWDIRNAQDWKKFLAGGF